MLVNIKKLFARSLCCLALMLPAAAHGEPMNGNENTINVAVNGSQIAFEDQQPVIINGRTLLPIRGVMEAMGKQVSWIEVDKTTVITDGTTTVKLRIGDSVMQQTVSDTHNNEEITFDTPLDTPPVIINNRTCLPIRAVAEAFMAAVDWDEATQSVLIVTED